MPSAEAVPEHTAALPPSALGRLSELVRRAGELDPRAFLGRPYSAVDSELVRPLARLCEEALRVVDRLAAAAPEDDELAGTCFAARLELRHGSRLLAQERDRASMLVGCDIARQGLLRTGTALLSPKAEAARDERARGRGAALVRALYARMRQVVESVDAQTGRRALLAVEQALGEAAARPEFAAVRLSDHFVLENVRRRLSELVARSASPEEIAELVSDAKATVDLLANIGQRPELRAYDLHLVATLRAALARGEAGRALLVQVRELVRGRDPGLDEALAGATRHLELPKAVAEALAQELLRVESELQGGGPPVW